MSRRILAIGIEHLPHLIKSMSWLYAITDRPNISDYDIVFVDYGTYPHNFLKSLSDDERKEHYSKIHQVFNQRRFLEIIYGGIWLFIFIDQGAPLEWLSNIVDVLIINDKGKMKKVLQPEWQKYFDLLKEWHLYFYIDLGKGNVQNIKSTVLAHTRARQPIGVWIQGFSTLYQANEFTRPQEKFIPTNIFLLHTLEKQSKEGVLYILENILNIPLTQEEPEWSKRIDFEKGKAIKTEIEQLEKQKKEIENQIDIKTKELEDLYKFKKLLWATGHELEKIVRRFFRELLGIIISESTKSEEDGVFKINSRVYVVEIKSGKRRGAKFEELSKLIARMETISKNHPDKKIRGLFIMNHFAEFPVSERKSPFPDNVKKTAEVNDVKLITTVELFEIAKDIIDGKMERTQAIEKILDLTKKA